MEACCVRSSSTRSGKIDFAAQKLSQLVCHFSFSTSCPLNRTTKPTQRLAVYPVYLSRSEVALGLGALHAKAQLDFGVLGGHVPLSFSGLTSKSPEAWDPTKQQNMEMPFPWWIQLSEDNI